MAKKIRNKKKDRKAMARRKWLRGHCHVCGRTQDLHPKIWGGVEVMACRYH